MIQDRHPAMQYATGLLDRLGAAGPKARYALALIRIVNGAIALVAPSIIVKRFGETPGESAAATYGLRLFGVRTVLIGVDLITQRGPALRQRHRSGGRNPSERHLDRRRAGHLRPVAASNGHTADIDLSHQHRARDHLVAREQTPGAMMTTEAGSPAAGAEAPYDYIVVGAGAGGGPLAANLADAGMRVLLLEAGIEGGTDGDSRSDSDDYAVPAFHGRASEDPATSWQFFVRHYEDTAQQECDNKYVATRDGVFYPRAAAVGGCTAHNAMITVHPHDADWDDIAALTGDESWRSDVMRDYFERLEACGYRKAPWMRRPQKPLTVLKTLTDPTHPAGSAGPQTFLNQETHWWDASQGYGGGSAPVDKHSRRSGVDGKLLISDDGKLVLPDDPKLNPELLPGWWLGLDMMGTVFVREHNSICDALRRAYPRWTDEELYHRARLINASLVAKIHTAEWTPAIIAHPTTITALHANWWGVAGERVRQIFGRLSNSEVISGIPGTGTEHYGVPYALTEEFTIVYRMHPLIPDDYTFKSVVDDSVLEQRTFRDIAGPHAREVTDRISLANLFYSFGIAYPGALVLNNYPRFLQEFQRPDNNRLMDLAATSSRPVRSRSSLTIPRSHGGSATSTATSSASTGMFAEKRPKGFGFSDTAFRVFILMASRRLNSDRFFTKDFTPEMYTPEGLTWVQNTTMIDILLRHYPQLRPALRGVTNAFQPWSQVSS